MVFHGPVAISPRIPQPELGDSLWISLLLQLNDSTGGRCRLIARIRRSTGFNEKNMGLVLGDRPVLNALGHYEYFARTKSNSAVSQLNRDMPNENQEEIVRIVMLVPNEFALDLHDHEVVTVEAADNSRLPIF